MDEANAADGLGWEDALEAFSTFLKAQNRSPETIRAYLSCIRRVFSLLREKNPTIAISQVTKRVIDEVLATPDITLTEQGTERSPASLHRYKAVIRIFFAWATNAGLTASNPAESLKLGRLPRKPPRFPTDSEKR